MPDTEARPNQEPTHEPNFELPRHGVIREDNWAEYQARGFEAVDHAAEPTSTIELRFSQTIYGVEHVYTGDAWDEAEGRPLRLKPGVGIYADPEGLAIGEERSRERDEWMRQHGYGPEDDPATN